MTVEPAEDCLDLYFILNADSVRIFIFRIHKRRRGGKAVSNEGNANRGIVQYAIKKKTLNSKNI